MRHDGAMTELGATHDDPARSGGESSEDVERPDAVKHASDSARLVDAVQFGRPEMSPWRRWWPFAFLVVWYGGLWITGNLGGSGLPLTVPVVVIATNYWVYRDFDRSARVEPDAVMLRTARHVERVPAHEVTDIRLEKTPGWFSHSVYVSIKRGRFDSFELQNVKAKDTPEERAPLQAKVDAALAVLRGDDTPRANDAPAATTL